MTSADLITKAQSLLGIEGDALDFRLMQLIPSALRRLSTDIADSADRELLRKDYSVVLTSGVGSISANLAASEPPLVERFMGWNLYASDSTYSYQPLPDRLRLVMADPTGLGYFILDGSTLRTKNASGSLTGLAETVTLRAPYLVSLANVPAQLEPNLVFTLAGMFQPQGVAA